MPIPFIGSIVAFVVALLVGGLAIYLSARFVVDVNDYSHAVVTALLGALGWALTSWVPLVGPVIALVVWVGVINWRYPGGWVKAAVIGGGAWVAALLVLLVVNSIFRLGIGAFGVPGV
ncbi:hypothetical protein [Halorubrum tibetense]|uniref:Metal ABC transporter permease n=1 Tax=Halorubrum tibetense TaxID=175631 RepID=A0ABD5SB12_9EURY